MDDERRRRLGEIDERWWGVHTTTEYHPDGTEKRVIYHAVHRHAGEDIGYLLQTACDLLIERASLVEALVEREARLLWAANEQRAWYTAYHADQEEYRGYARAVLHERGLLPAEEARP